ncbi:MAG: glycosyltransferase, partial [Candidatus Promineifilaceae bacterium]
IVKKEGVGLVFEPENSRELLEKLSQMQGDRGLMDQFRSRCRESATRYQRSAMAERMAEILNKVATQKGGSQKEYRSVSGRRLMVSPF